MQELSLRTAVVHATDPVRKLYRVQVVDNPPLEKYAIPLGGLHTFSNDTGAVNFISYSIGDKVLVVCPENNWNSRTSLLWIVGLLPVVDEIKDNGQSYSIFSGMSKLSEILANAANTLLQDKGFLAGFSARENSPDDVRTGDWYVNGQNTIASVGDYNVLSKAGNALIFLDSNFNSITESSLFRNIYSIGSSNRVQYYRKYLLSTENYVGNVKDSLRNNPVFRKKVAFSDLLHGSREVLTTSDDKPLIVHENSFDGSSRISAAGLVSIGRSCGVPWYELTNKELTVVGDSVEVDKTTPLNTLNKLPDWKRTVLSDSSKSIYETTFDVVGLEEWETPDTTDTTEFTDSYSEEKFKVSNKPTGLTCLPDGSVLIRDGFGSEIRMCHGNIQISSANNTTLLCGRDLLSIVSGMYASTAGSGIEFGTGSGNIVVNAKNELRIAANTYKRSTVDSILLSEGKHMLKSSVYSVDASSASLRSSGAPLMLGARSLIFSADSQVIINTKNAAFCVGSNYISVGGSAINLYGNVSVQRDKMSITGLVDIQGNEYNITIPSSNASFIVAGNVCIDKQLIVNKEVQSASGIIAKWFGAKDLNATSGIFGLEKAPKVINLSKELREFKLEFGATLKSAVASIVNFFTEDAIAKIKQVFTKVSKACKIYKPPFSRSSSSSNIKPSSCESVKGKVSYIYPGERFWTIDGLVTENKDRDNMNIKRDLEYSGVTGIAVNTPNVQEK